VLQGHTLIVGGTTDKTVAPIRRMQLKKREGEKL